MSRKVIITCAVTGAIHTPSMSPHLPVTAKEIADAALGAAKAGAAIVHLHARNPVDGSPSQDPELFTPFLKEIKEKSNVVINLTTGGAPTMTIADRLRPAHHFKPEVASLNMGSMNFGLYPMLKRFKDFKHSWERDHLEGSRDLVFRNSFQDIEYVLKTCYGNGTRFEFECYDISHLYNLAHFADRGLVKAGNFRRSGNKLAYAYVLTPTGLREKLRLTRTFLLRKEAEFEHDNIEEKFEYKGPLIGFNFRF